MIEPSRKGWCPSLETPMATGDGLLARLHPRHGSLSPVQLAGLAEAAARHGNGLLEITTRGNLQIRGLTPASAEEFGAAVLALGIEPEPAPEIRLPPAPVLDEATNRLLVEMAGTLRSELHRSGMSERLAPKFSIVVEAAGYADLAELSGDIRVSLLSSGSDPAWSIGLAGNRGGARHLARGSTSDAVRVALALAGAVAALGPSARAKHLAEAGLARIVRDGGLTISPPTSAPQHATEPVGPRSLPGGAFALGCAPAFGQVEATVLARFCAALPETSSLYVCPGRILLVANLTTSDAVDVENGARSAGLVTEPADPRLSIMACAGAPACAGGRLATRALASRIAAENPSLAGGHRIYLAGCAKQCARPEGPHVAVTGEEGNVLIVDTETGLTEGERALLAALGRDLLRSGRP
jgi:precorrin-3B synthase